jgi:hypothetical protein
MVKLQFAINALLGLTVQTNKLKDKPRDYPQLYAGLALKNDYTNYCFWHAPHAWCYNIMVAVIYFISRSNNFVYTCIIFDIAV